MLNGCPLDSLFGSTEHVNGSRQIDRLLSHGRSSNYARATIVWRLHSSVALSRVWDLLVCAKHLLKYAKHLL
jgi:hypothetical protein